MAGAERRPGPGKVKMEEILRKLQKEASGSKYKAIKESCTWALGRRGRRVTCGPARRRRVRVAQSRESPVRGGGIRGAWLGRGHPAASLLVALLPGPTREPLPSRGRPQPHPGVRTPGRAIRGPDCQAPARSGKLNQGPDLRHWAVEAGRKGLFDLIFFPIEASLLSVSFHGYCAWKTTHGRDCVASPFRRGLPFRQVGFQVCELR